MPCTDKPRTAPCRARAFQRRHDTLACAHSFNRNLSMRQNTPDESNTNPDRKSIKNRIDIEIDRPIAHKERHKRKRSFVHLHPPRNLTFLFMLAFGTTTRASMGLSQMPLPICVSHTLSYPTGPRHKQAKPVRQGRAGGRRGKPFYAATRYPRQPELGRRTTADRWVRALSVPIYHTIQHYLRCGGCGELSYLSRKKR